jgi:3-methyladenine DNA glycosylase AlkC
MTSQIELSVGQQFEIERFSRAIDANTDAEQLRSLAKQLLQAWHTQKAATNWVIQQQLATSLPQGAPLDPAA